MPMLFRFYPLLRTLTLSDTLNGLLQGRGDPSPPEGDKNSKILRMKRSAPKYNKGSFRHTGTSALHAYPVLRMFRI